MEKVTSRRISPLEQISCVLAYPPSSSPSHFVSESGQHQQQARAVLGVSEYYETCEDVDGNRGYSQDGLGEDFVVYHPLMHVYMGGRLNELIEKGSVVYKHRSTSELLYKTPQEARKALQNEQLMHSTKKHFMQVFDNHHVFNHNPEGQLPKIALKYMEKLETVSYPHQNDDEQTKTVSMCMFFPDGQPKQIHIRTSGVTTKGEPVLLKKSESRRSDIGTPGTTDQERTTLYDQRSVHDLLWWDYGSRYGNESLIMWSKSHKGLCDSKLSDENAFGGQPLLIPEHLLSDPKDKLVIYWNFSGTTAPENIWACGLFLSTGFNITSDVSHQYPYPRGPVILAYYSHKDRGLVNMTYGALSRILSRFNDHKMAMVRQFMGMNTFASLPQACRLPQLVSARYFLDGSNIRTCGERGDLIHKVNSEIEQMNLNHNMSNYVLSQAGWREPLHASNAKTRIANARGILLSARLLFSLRDLASFQGLNFGNVTLTLRETVLKLNNSERSKNPTAKINKTKIASTIDEVIPATDNPMSETKAPLSQNQQASTTPVENFGKLFPKDDDDDVVISSPVTIPLVNAEQVGSQQPQTIKPAGKRTTSAANFSQDEIPLVNPEQVEPQQPQTIKHAGKRAISTANFSQDDVPIEEPPVPKKSKKSRGTPHDDVLDSIPATSPATLEAQPYDSHPCVVGDVPHLLQDVVPEATQKNATTRSSKQAREKVPRQSKRTQEETTQKDTKRQSSRRQQKPQQ